MNYYFGVDIGGTNIAFGLVNENNEIICKNSIKTNAPRAYESICDDIAVAYRDTVKKAGVNEREVAWIGIGSPGIIMNGVVVQADNLKFKNAPLANTVAKRTGKKVFLANDANAAAYGELIAGSGMGHNSFVAVTLGTGIGSGIILNRKIYEGFSGGGAEIGHIIICADGRKCVCGSKGCFEAYCSATALIKDTKKAMIENTDSIMWQLCGGDVAKVSGRTAFDAMRKGDAAAAEVVDNFISWLSVGITNIVNLLQPEMICIGGGISGEGDALLIPLKEKVEQQCLQGANNINTEIVIAKLGNDAGILGAAMLGKQEEK